MLLQQHRAYRAKGRQAASEVAGHVHHVAVTAGERDGENGLGTMPTAFLRADPRTQGWPVQPEALCIGPHTCPQQVVNPHTHTQKSAQEPKQVLWS